MMRYFLSLFFLFGFYLHGQTVTYATSQDWSGGACCYSGTNYDVSFTIESSSSSFQLQKIYLKGHGELTGSLKELDQINGTKHLAVSFGTSTNQNGAFLKENPVQNKTPEFTGTALIILHVDHKEVKIIVGNFRELEHQAYP